MKRLLIVTILALAIAFGLGAGLGLGWRLGGNSEVSLPALDLHLSQGGRAWAQAPVPAQAATSPRHTIVVDVAQALSPAVVSIGVTKTTYQRDPFFGDNFFFPNYLVVPHRRQFPYLGSGVILDAEGHVLTNYHVIEDAEAISVTLTDNRSYSAQLLDADRYVDIALLKITDLKPGETLPIAVPGDSDDVMIGETVLAIGNPYGPLIADPQPSVSVGVISAVNRSFKTDPSKPIYQNMIQTDAAINPGNSGGPLVNLAGEVIGINTFIFSRSGDSASIGFSIPINRCMRVVEEIKQYGKIRAIAMDFESLSLTPYIIQVLDLSVTRGALVRAIDLGGSAETAGLQPGDVIVGCDGIDVASREDLIAQFLARTVGETLRFTVIRQGERVEVDYVIKEGT